MTDLTELGKIKQALNNKIDRDFQNNNKEALNREISNSEILVRSQSNYAGENKSEINAQSGWLHYDEDSDILEIKRKDGEWREIGGASSELKGQIDVIHCKESTVVDPSTELVIELDERYPATIENLQVFVSGKIINSEFIKVSDNGLTISVSPEALEENAQVKVQYFNFVPRSAVKAGIQTLGQITESTVSNFLESGSVYADGFVYERTSEGDFKYELQNEDDQTKWISTEDFSEELYVKLRFANRNEFDSSVHPEYETLLNDDRSNYIDALSFENWGFTGNEVFFALDPERHRYIVPRIDSEISSIRKCVVVKSIYSDVLSIGKSILSMDFLQTQNLQILKSYVDSSSNKILENKSSVQYRKINDSFVLLGPTKLFYPNGTLNNRQQYSETILSKKSTAYLSLSPNSLDDGDYYVLLNKIGNDSTSYTVRYIKPEQFFICNELTEKETGAYLYEDNSKLEIYINGLKDEFYYSLPVCMISVLEGSLKTISNCNNYYHINNGLIINPQIFVNIPLGFDDRFSRRNIISELDTPQFVSLFNSEIAYLELENNLLTLKSSDAQFSYDYNKNVTKLGDMEIKACLIWSKIDPTVGETFKLQSDVYIEEEILPDSENAVSSSAIYNSLEEKADIFLENTGFISNCILSIPENGVGSINENTYKLNKNIEFLVADGLNLENNRLKSDKFSTQTEYLLEISEAINNGYIFFNIEEDKLFIVKKYIQQEISPVDCENGTLWYSRNTNLIKIFDGTEWNIIKSVEVANHLNTDSSGNIVSVQNCKVLTSGEGKIYQAGNGVDISDDGTISVTELEWGNIKGDISNQNDLQESLDSIIVRISLISPLSNIEEIQSVYGLELKDGEFIFDTTHNKFYEVKENSLTEVSSQVYRLTTSKLYISEFDQKIYSWTGLEMVPHRKDIINEIVEVSFKRGEQNIQLPSPCVSSSQIIVVSVGQVILDLTDYYLSNNNSLVLEIPAINDGYIKYFSSNYEISNLINNFSKHVEYTVDEDSKSLRIPLGATCGNSDSIIAFSSEFGVISNSEFMLENKNTVLLINSDSVFKKGSKINIWFGIVFGQSFSQSDWEEKDEQSSSFIRNKPELELAIKRLNLTGTVEDEYFVCKINDPIVLEPERKYELRIHTENKDISKDLKVVVEDHDSKYNINNILQLDVKDTLTLGQLDQVKNTEENVWIFESKFVDEEENKYFLTSGSFVNAESFLPKVDEKTVKVNSENKLEAVAISTGQVELKLSTPMTLSEYEKIPEKDPYTIYNITDDYPEGEYSLTDLSNLSEQGIEIIRRYSSISEEYTDLVLGASGTVYTAPENGIFALNVLLYGSGNIEMLTYPTEIYGVKAFMPENGSVKLIIPVSKGQKITVKYSGLEGTVNYFRFIYTH